MDIVKHKRNQYSYDNGNHGSSDVGLIVKQNNPQHKERQSHKSSRESIESVSDIDSIDDRDSREEGEYRIK